MDFTRTDGGPAATPIQALLLDDSAFDRARIRRMAQFADLPVVIDEAPTLTSLAEKLDTNTYDLVMIDYRLSEGDGLAALDILQADSRHRDTAKIMISGNDRIDIAVTALKRGCDDYISKRDISRAQLEQVFRQVLARAARGFPTAAELETAVEGALLRALQTEVVRSSLARALRLAADPPAASDELRHWLQRFEDSGAFEFRQTAPHTQRSDHTAVD